MLSMRPVPITTTSKAVCSRGSIFRTRKKEGEEKGYLGKRANQKQAFFKRKKKAKIFLVHSDVTVRLVRLK